MCALHKLLATEPHGVGVVENFDVFFLGYAFLHRSRCAQIRLTHNHIHLFGKVAQIVGFFASGVASAHHSHHFFAIEKSIAGGARRHAHAGKFLLVSQSQILGRSTGGDNHGIGSDSGAIVDGCHKGTLSKIDAAHHPGANNGTHIFGLLLHIIHQIEAFHPVRKTRKIFNGSGLGKLTPGLNTGIKYTAHSGARKVDGCREAGGSGAYNQTFCGLHNAIVGFFAEHSPHKRRLSPES